MMLLIGNIFGFTGRVMTQVSRVGVCGHVNKSGGGGIVIFDYFPSFRPQCSPGGVTNKKKKWDFIQNRITEGGRNRDYMNPTVPFFCFSVS